MTSFSVIPPTPGVDDVDAHLGVLDLPSSPTSASTEPCTSPLRTRLRSWTAPSCICAKSVSSETPPLRRCASCSRRSRSARFCARSRAWRSFSTTRASSPAGGGWSKPRISTGVAGLRLLDASRRGSRRARAPCPTRRRRRSRRRRGACRAGRASSRPGRGPTSRRDSMIGPGGVGASGSPSGRARRRRRAGSSRAGRRGPGCCFAETSANCVVAAPLLGLEPLGRELGAGRGRGSRRAGRSC